MEKLIDKSLRKTQGDVKKAAALMGISQRNFYLYLDKMNIDVLDYRPIKHLVKLKPKVE